MIAYKYTHTPLCFVISHKIKYAVSIHRFNIPSVINDSFKGFKIFRIYSQDRRFQCVQSIISLNAKGYQFPIFLIASLNRLNISIIIGHDS